MAEIRFYQDVRGEGPQNYEGSIAADGELRLPPGCATHFPSTRATAYLRDEDELWLLPADADDDEALVLRQRTLAGERVVNIRSVWPDHPVGRVTATWSVAHRRLEIVEEYA